MEKIFELFHTLLSFFVSFIDLFVGFFISLANLFMQFVHAIAGIIS